VTFRKHLVLAGVTVFSAVGDTLLSHGMRETGTISLHHASSIFLVVLHPVVALGIFFLLAFFACYMTALSWADLTYVLPATSLSYVLLTVIARVLLHENVSLSRWLGVLLISAGVGFVTQGPALTHKQHAAEPQHHPAESLMTEVQP